MAKADSDIVLLERSRFNRDERPFEPNAKSITIPTLKNRVGLISAWLLLASLLLVIIATVFLAFIWFASPENHLWRDIVTRNWASRVVSFTSTGIRWAIGTQTATCLAMLAALALEKYLVPHPDVAAVSMMRIDGSGLVGTLRDLIVPLVIRGPRWDRSSWSIVSIALGLLTTSTTLQFTSTLLLSDLAQISIADFPTKSNVTIDYRYNADLTDYDYFSDLNPTWSWGNRRPTTFYRFAEYSQPNTTIVGESITDTGMTIRAFLPYQSGDDRQKMHEYRGKALVLDVRVACMPPKVENVKMEFVSTIYYAFEGTVAPSQNSSELILPQSATNFSCFTSVAFDNNGYSICELMHGLDQGAGYFGGSIHSALRTQADHISGAAYLIISDVPQSGREWKEVNVVRPVIGDDELWYLTLCYSGLDAADRNIHAFSSSVHAEPEVTTNVSSSSYKYSQVLSQLGNGSASDRGVLDLTLLDGETWSHPYSANDGSDGPIDPVEDASLPYVMSSLHLRIPDEDQNEVVSPYTSIYGNYSEVLCASALLLKSTSDFLLGQQWLIDLWGDLMTQGSTAKALQGLLTILAGQIYYDQDNFDSYDKIANVTTSFFNIHVAPARIYHIHVGKINYYTSVPTFFTLVMIILGVHHTVVAMVFWRFWKETQLSRLGDPWQAVANVVLGDETQLLLNASSAVDANRETARRRMKQAGLENVLVGISATDDHVISLQRRN